MLLWHFLVSPHHKPGQKGTDVFMEMANVTPGVIALAGSARLPLAGLSEGACPGFMLYIMQEKLEEQLQSDYRQ